MKFFTRVCCGAKLFCGAQGEVLPAPVALFGSVAERAVLLATVIGELGSRPRLARSMCQVIAAYALKFNSRAGTEIRRCPL